MRRSIQYVVPLLIVVLLAAHPSQSAQGQPRPKQETQQNDDVTLSPNAIFGDPLSGATMRGAYVYARQGYGLERSQFVIYDTSYSESLRRVGALSIDVGSITLDGSYAYILGSAGLSIVDISTPSNLHVARLYEQFAQGYSLRIADGYLYISVGSSVRIYRLASPLDLVKAGSYDVEEGFTVGVRNIQGQYAYLGVSKSIGNVVTSNRVDILDITDREHPSKAGEIRLKQSCSGPYAGPYIGDIFIWQNFLYVILSSPGNQDCYTYDLEDLHIYDISNFSRPTYVSQRSIGGGTSSRLKATMEGSRLYLARSSSPDRSSNISASFEVLDVSDPRNITTYAGGHVGDDEVSAISVDTTIHVLMNYGGLKIIGITDPKNPLILTINPPITKVHAMEVQGSNIYVADTSNRRILFHTMSDVPASIPQDGGATRLSPLSEYQVLPYERTLMSIAIHANYAYVADLPAAALYIINVEYPHVPREINVLRGIGFNDEVVIVGQYLYVFGFAYNNPQHTILRVFDIADPFVPREVRIIDPFPYITNMVVSGTYGFASSWTSLQILDLSDPTLPTIAGEYELPDGGTIADVVTDGTYAYVATQEGKMLVLDITDPVEPQLETTFEPQPASALTKVYVSGQRLFLASDEQVHVLNISEPAAPREIGLLNMRAQPFGSISELAVVGEHIYVLKNDEYDGRLYQYTITPAANRMFLPLVHRSGRMTR